MATGAEYNWMVLWKSLNTEMPQNKEETPQKLFFCDVSEISARKTEIPQNPVFEGFPLYYEAFPKIFKGFCFSPDN